MKYILNFNPDKPERCKHCNKYRGNHKAGTLQCPFGTPHRVVGYTHYLETRFEAKEKAFKKGQRIKEGKRVP